MTIKIAVLISGRGSNLNAIIQAIADGELDAEIATVVSSKEDAPGLLIASQHGIDTFTAPYKGVKRRQHEEIILDHLKKFELDYIVLAGYMRVLSPFFLRHFPGPELKESVKQEGETSTAYRVVNIHPSLLPAFPGTRGYEEAFAYGVKVSGVTVHLVDEKIDHGPILAQEPFPRFQDDTLESFCARGLSVEHALYPAVLQQIAKNGLVGFFKNRVVSH